VSEENKALIRRFTEEYINQGNLALASELLTSTYVNYLAPPGIPPGPDGENQVLTMFRSAFPDGQVTLEDILAEGDRVAVRLTFSGTHQGEFMGIPPTGRSFTIVGMNVFRIEDGKIAENWPQLDMLGLMQQLGIIPEPGGSEEASPT
jgi:steroid delta-isomerase-like uncharacterized protein